MKVEWQWEVISLGKLPSISCLVLSITDLKLPTHFLSQDVRIHFHVYRKYWQWGYVKSWWDGSLHSFGFGPLFLICWRDAV